MRYILLGIKCRKEDLLTVQQALASIRIPAIKTCAIQTDEDGMETRHPLIHSLLNPEYVGKIPKKSVVECAT